MSRQNPNMSDNTNKVFDQAAAFQKLWTDSFANMVCIWCQVSPDPPKPYQIAITSMRQAFEILELPPGRITLSAASSAYKQRMLEYHPDRTAHLGQELQELAARKALEINLAWKFIQEHCK